MLSAIRHMDGGMPPITMAWCVIIVASIVLFNFHPEYKKDLSLHWGRVLYHGEYWRCATTFLCFGGKFGTGKLIDLFLISQSSARLEQQSRAHFVLSAILCCLGLLYIDYNKLLYWHRHPWLSHGLTLALISTASWQHPFKLTTLAPLPLPPFPSYLLPPMLCAQSALLFGSSWQTMVAPVVISLPCHLIIVLIQEMIGMVPGTSSSSGKAKIELMFGKKGDSAAKYDAGEAPGVGVVEEEEKVCEDSGAVLVDRQHAKSE